MDLRRGRLGGRQVLQGLSRDVDSAGRQAPAQPGAQTGTSSGRRRRQASSSRPASSRAPVRITRFARPMIASPAIIDATLATVRVPGTKVAVVQVRARRGSIKADPTNLGPEATPENASASSDRSVPGVGAPLISRGGRQGIGDQSDFPSGLLTTAQPVGCLKPFVDWILRLAIARCAAPCDWFWAERRGDLDRRDSVESSFAPGPVFFVPDCAASRDRGCTS